MWKILYGNEEYREYLLKIMVECWSSGTVPGDWTSCYLTVLPKKGDVTLPANYRGMSIGESLSKVCATILKHRPNDLCEQLAPEYCYGFRRGRGRMDCIYAAKSFLRMRKEKCLESFGAFFDVKKCFDVIPRGHVWKSMRKMGVSPKMIEAVQSTLHNSSCELRVDGEKANVTMKDGTAQGSTLGPTPCNLFFLPILLLWQKKLMNKNPPTVQTENGDGTVCDTHLPIHNFADGTLIIAASRSAAEEVARDFISCLQDFQMQAHKGTPSKPKSKTVVVHFYSSAAARDATDHSPMLMDPNGNEFVNFESSVVYLGALLNFAKPHKCSDTFAGALWQVKRCGRRLKDACSLECSHLSCLMALKHGS